MKFENTTESAFKANQDGSIDYAYYDQQARALRSRKLAEVIEGKQRSEIFSAIAQFAQRISRATSSLVSPAANSAFAPNQSALGRA